MRRGEVVEGADDLVHQMRQPRGAGGAAAVLLQHRLGHLPPGGQLLLEQLQRGGADTRSVAVAAFGQRREIAAKDVAVDDLVEFRGFWPYPADGVVRRIEFSDGGLQMAAFCAWWAASIQLFPRRRYRLRPLSRDRRRAVRSGRHADAAWPFRRGRHLPRRGGNALHEAEAVVERRRPRNAETLPIGDADLAAAPRRCRSLSTTSAIVSLPITWPTWWIISTMARSLRS